MPEGFRVQGSGFGASGLGCRVLGFCFRVVGFGFEVSVSGSGPWDHDANLQTSVSGLRIPDSRCRALGSGFQVSGFGFRVEFEYGSVFGFRSDRMGSGFGFGSDTSGASSNLCPPPPNPQVDLASRDSSARIGMVSPLLFGVG